MVDGTQIVHAIALALYRNLQVRKVVLWSGDPSPLPREEPYTKTSYGRINLPEVDAQNKVFLGPAHSSLQRCKLTVTCLTCLVSAPSTP